MTLLPNPEKNKQMYFSQHTFGYAVDAVFILSKSKSDTEPRKDMRHSLHDPLQKRTYFLYKKDEHNHTDTKRGQKKNTKIGQKTFRLSGFRRGETKVKIYQCASNISFSAATYIRELHFLIVVNGCYCYFTLTDKVIVVDVIRQETQSCNEPNTVSRKERGYLRRGIYKLIMFTVYIFMIQILL